MKMDQSLSSSTAWRSTAKLGSLAIFAVFFLIANLNSVGEFVVACLWIYSSPLIQNLIFYLFWLLLGFGIFGCFGINGIAVFGVDEFVLS